MSEPHHSFLFHHHEHDDVDASGFQRPLTGEDPLSPDFGQAPSETVSRESHSDSPEGLHPAEVEKPARVLDPVPESASESPVEPQPAAGSSSSDHAGVNYSHNLDASAAENGYSGSNDPLSPTFGATSPTLGLSPSGSPTMGTFSLYDIGMARNPIRDDDAGTLVSPTPARLPLPPPIDLDKVTAKLTNKEVFANTGLVFKPEPPATKPEDSAAAKVAEKRPKGILDVFRKDKPKPRYVPETRWIRFQLWFNTYRKFFTFIVIFQLIGMILAGTHHFPYARKNTGGIIVGNIMAAVIVRNEIFGRFLYLTVNTLFAKWTPLWFRLACTSTLQHLGGIHSGCSLSALGWLIFNLTYLFRDRHNQNKGVLTMAFIVMFVIAFACLSAFPIVRNTHHNVFERNHRLFGWAAVVVTWIYVILANGYRDDPHHWHSNGHAMGVHQELWLTLIMSIAVILPWLFTYKVPIHVEIPSQKVAVLRFERGMQQGLLGRISRTAILEYHAFGTISEGTHAKYHYMVCGVQGDFTRGLVRDQPTHIWTRELKFAGVGNTSTLYKRGIRICTGTGIGAALSTCLQSDQWFLIWVGSDMLKTFGPTISELITRGVGPNRCILWDTKKSGRPKTMKLLAETVEKWQAEVVFITSNWDGNQELMQGCKRLGIPAFGTLWDF
ncbi:nonribosomal peptide synthetase [Ceratobasidium sp. AG-Ba]|nr:nonribosomal peptide synthetase [Ceratobasidium sp. AG-Ba]QRW07278.1 nonribosomal peptide synthetase [Ceratobasidium sp. AG-Ba]